MLSGTRDISWSEGPIDLEKSSLGGRPNDVTSPTFSFDVLSGLLDKIQAITLADVWKNEPAEKLSARGRGPDFEYLQLNRQVIAQLSAAFKLDKKTLISACSQAAPGRQVRRTHVSVLEAATLLLVAKCREDDLPFASFRSSRFSQFGAENARSLFKECEEQEPRSLKPHGTSIQTRNVALYTRMRELGIPEAELMLKKIAAGQHPGYGEKAAQTAAKALI